MLKHQSECNICTMCPYAEIFDKPDIDEDNYHEIGNKKHNPRKTGTAYRRLMYKQKKDRLMKIINDGYNLTAYVDFDYVNGEREQTGKHIKFPKNSNQQKFFKRYSNRIARRKELPTKGNGYRRHFDYWWTLY